MDRMNDWSGYRAQLEQGFGALAKLNPALMSSMDALNNAAPSPAALDVKTRELIAVAVATTTRCDGCLAFHTHLAREAGATKEELAEALGVAIALHAGAGLVYSARALEAFGEVG